MTLESADFLLVRHKMYQEFLLVPFFQRYFSYSSKNVFKKSWIYQMIWNNCCKRASCHHKQWSNSDNYFLPYNNDNDIVYFVMKTDHVVLRFKQCSSLQPLVARSQENLHCHEPNRILLKQRPDFMNSIQLHSPPCADLCPGRTGS